MSRMLHRRPGVSPHLSSSITAALVAALAFCIAASALAQEVATTEESLRPYDDLGARIRATTPRRATAAQATASETTWVGHKAGATGNHWSIGTGPARGDVDMRGMWTWDQPVHGDSLQGWWPVRFAQTSASGHPRIDTDRPWWAIEIGNQANYVINQGRFDASKLGTAHPGNRTFGVVGVWHSDPGDGAVGTGVNWSPLAGTRSAWMGLRRHGDLTALDPITGNPFNVDLTALGRVVLSSAANTTRQFAGYASQMDQMLYRDLDLSGAPADSGVRLTFRFRTQMSTGKVTAASTRTGWYEGDPLTLNTVTPGNFISAEAGVPANSLAPVDSFQVYVGAPVEGSWVGSDNATRPVYDPLRRWFNEVLAKGTRYWKFARAGADSGEVTLVITKAQKDAIVAAAGSPTLRVVFRVHTNQTGSDEDAIATYTSNGRGAAQVDDVRYDAGLGSVTIGDFEGGDPAKDIDNLQPASAAWRSTGKPPGITFHVHDLATLVWEDICGPLGSANASCDMSGPVVAMGNHDLGEVTPPAGQAEPDAAGNWGMVSPTIGLAASPGVKNAFDLTLEEATGDEYVIAFDRIGRFDIFNYSQSWQVGIQSYPTLGPDGTPAWGDIRTTTYLEFDPITRCRRSIGWQSGLVMSANGAAPPDSIRLVLRQLVQWYRFGFGMPSFTAGQYFDNVSLGIVHAAQPVFTADIWDWFQDTFPFNETAGLPATPAFDTTSALVRTGLNIAQTTGTLQRYDVPGDSALVTATGGDVRVDLVFRVYPGPGNHVIVGDRASGLRRVPTSPIPAAPGDGSWWGTWILMPGDFATPGAGAYHAAWPGGWNPNVWMSARCDTAQMNLFPIDGRGIGALPAGRWMSTYHEDDPHYAILGIARSKCFLVDTAGANNSTNITCSTVPPWVNAGGTGYDGSPTTVEGTRILPDGLFTPGTHVEYFWRRSAASSPAAMTAMVPDTTTVVPQPGEGSYDGHRWQAFGVLPDRWKDIEYGGSGDPCMLVLDLADRRGDELAWISIADSTGMTGSWKTGTHNGWHAWDGRSPNDPASFVAAHAGQAGILFDLYQVKAGELSTSRAGSIGSRLSYRDASPTNLVHGKYSTQGPTLEMLLAYYRQIVLLTGDLGSGVLGPTNDVSPDDAGLLTSFLQSATQQQQRAIEVFGDGFAESEAGSPFLSDMLGMDLHYHSYLELSGVNDLVVDLIPDPSALPWLGILGVRNACAASPDVLTVNGAVGAQVLASYPPVGATSFTAAVLKPATPTHPWIAATHGFGIQQLVSRYGAATAGRNTYVGTLQQDRFSAFCTLHPVCYDEGIPVGCGDVPPADRALVDGVRLFNTPLAHGSATVEFTLAAPDRVTIGLYDVGGRLVRTLAERAFEAGAQRLAWDGTDDAGRRLNAGVYFARVRYAARGFESARKLVVLK